MRLSSVALGGIALAKNLLKLAGCVSLGLLLYTAHAEAQSGDVTAKLVVSAATLAKGKKIRAHAESSQVVLWLIPVDGPAPIVKGTYRMVQKDKQFSPHLLVIPTGSSVTFPNQDPFFHNVFSMYNGKRFDLGLYEAGSSKTIVFDREGVSYLFCNIHPEMGAIILAVSTPYYAVANVGDTVTVHHVPPGRYHVQLWGQQFESADKNRVVQVTAQGASLGMIELTPTTDPMMNHKNKFGENYPMEMSAPY